MSEDSEALVREIEEEVRREKMTKLWDQYGAFLIGGLVAVVLIVGGVQWFSAYQIDRAQKAGAQFNEAVTMLDGDKKKDGLAGLEQIAKEGTAAYATLAKLRLAASHRAEDKADDALALYEAVGADTSADQLLRSFANLQIASLKVDSGTWTDVQNRLNDLMAEDSPWRNSARELLGLAAYKHKMWAEAKKAYTGLLTDPGLTREARARVQTALALITQAEAGTQNKTGIKTGTGTQDKTDLKNDKTLNDGAKSTAGAADSKATPAPSNGAGANNDADKTK